MEMKIPAVNAILLLFHFPSLISLVVLAECAAKLLQHYKFIIRKYHFSYSCAPSMHDTLPLRQTFPEVVMQR